VGRAVGSRKTGADDRDRRGSGGAPHLPVFLVPKKFSAFISVELRALLSAPIKYRTRNGFAFGYEATLLPQMCQVILEAERAGAFKTETQRQMATRAGVIVMGLATVGVIALVDEATGYQEVREREALRRIFEEYICEDLRSWTSKFPEEFFREIFRLHGWAPKDSQARPQYVGHLINRYIYERLPIGVLEALRVRNPVNDETKRRRHKHHQFLTADTGNEALDRQIVRVVTLMQGAENLPSFDRAFRRVFPAAGDHTELPGMDPPVGSTSIPSA
jgi:hypothetical protein